MSFNFNNKTDKFVFKTETNSNLDNDNYDYESNDKSDDNDDDNNFLENNSFDNNSMEDNTSEQYSNISSVKSLLSSDTNNDDNNIETNTEYNTEYQDKIYCKYIKNDKTKNIKFNDEIKNILKQKNLLFDISVIKNNLGEVKKNINSGMYLFKNDNNHIIKICSNKNCLKLECSKECYKNNLYRSFWNFNRGIKTVYNLMFKLLLSYPIFRIQCKCCENTEYNDYFNNLDKNYSLNKNTFSILKNTSINTSINFEPIKSLELNINWLINKFMCGMGILDCECKFKNTFHSFYTQDYLNYANIINIYIGTIPSVIKLLKTYFEIKDNHEELALIDESRCIHEDIRYNNLTYCSKKKYNQISKKYLIELVMKLDLLNNWIFDCIKITNILLNQQSLEYFMYYCENNPSKLINNFNKIYSSNNNFLDLNYMSNKNNIINIINLYNNKFNANDIDKLFLLIYKQLTNRNKLISNYNVNVIIINYIYESISLKNISIAFKWLEYIKNTQKNKLELNKNLNFELEKIFDSLLDNDMLNIDTKISYLKIINKNKINIIEYDFVNKLLDLEIGDKIILEFDKEENSLFNINDYKNEIYIQEIIKKCIVSNKVNILDYILFKLNKSIIEFDIDIVSIYLLNIPKKYNNGCEYLYIGILKIIMKYYNKTNTKLIFGLENKKYTPIEYCIENNLYLSSKILILNSIDICNSNKKDFNLLINCFEKSNTIIFEYILESNPNIISTIVNGLNIFTHLFLYYEKKNITDTNSLYIFLFKILKHINETNCGLELINYKDELNELLGFKILNFNELCSEEKTILFKLIIKHIDPLEQNNILVQKNKIINTLNYPLIIHSMISDELEITFILLNNLLKKGIVKKNTIPNEISRIYDYYLLNNNININFIPIIFKYIKDNREKCNKFEENDFNHKQINITSGIKNTILLFLMCIKFTIFYFNNKYSFIFNNITHDDTINDINTNNKYIEITISSDDNSNELHISTDTLTNSNTKIYSYNNHKHKDKSKILSNSNKNIWVSSNSNNNKTNQSLDSINLSDSNETSNQNNMENNINKLYKLGMMDSNSSDLSESDILFEYN